jgi:uncharacterized protein (TIGR02391 family)
MSAFYCLAFKLPKLARILRPNRRTTDTMYGKPGNPYNFPAISSLRQLSAPEIGLRLLDVWRSERRIRTLPDFARAVATESYAGVEALEAAMLFMEGLSYMAREGLIIRDPGQSSEFYTLSRTGRTVKGETAGFPGIPRSLDAREILHPTIAAIALADIERGRQYFAEAIFKAFRKVEIMVRERSGINSYGVPLMREAFKKGAALYDSGVDVSEAEALAHLYAGAIGRFKNPGSHREVEESDVRLTFQLLSFASYLLSQIERIAPFDVTGS